MGILSDFISPWYSVWVFCQILFHLFLSGCRSLNQQIDDKAATNQKWTDLFDKPLHTRLAFRTICISDTIVVASLLGKILSFALPQVTFFIIRGMHYTVCGNGCYRLSKAHKAIVLMFKMFSLCEIYRPTTSRFGAVNVKSDLKMRIFLLEEREGNTLHVR